jgi:hypothetical protein
MKLENENLNEPQKLQLNIGAVMRSVVWKPSPLIRWKMVEIDKLRYNKVLQQLWQGDMGEEEWRDVPEEA